MIVITPFREALNLLVLETNRLVLFIPTTMWNVIPELGIIVLLSTLIWVAFYDFLVFYVPKVEDHKAEDDMTPEAWKA